MDSKFVPTLAEVESEVIDVDEINERGREAFLVGKLVTEKNWNPPNLIEAITEAWKMKHGGMSSREIGDSKLILFHFDYVMDRDWVLKNQPWHYKGSLFAIKEFTGGNEQQLSLDNVTIEHASFWVRLYDVPISCMNERSLRVFAKQIGILESVDKSDEDSIGRFLRFKISVNIMKPLLRGITIHAKGKHLWLPLKYESLPNYCFSCGTIGHVRKNCQSCNRNMEYSVCKLRASSLKRRKKSKCTLPLDIIENILSRVPVKNLCRFKAVSKQWKAIISHPIFAEIHLQQYKQSSSRYLVLDLQGFYLADLQNQDLKFVSAIEQPGEYRLLSDIECYCDGLYLSNPSNNNTCTYVLWNPSCRAYKEILCPTEFYRPLTGIYYNPLRKDYRIVVANKKHYAIFSCRYNIWSQVKMMKYYSHNDDDWGGVYFDGSFYWLIARSKNGEPYPPQRPSEMEFEILCFDGRDENFKKLSVPYCEGISEYSCLSSSGGHLCLLGRGLLDECFIFKKVNGDEKGSWMEFELQFDSESYFDYPYGIFWISENQFIFYHDDLENDMLYDLCENTHSDIPNFGYGRVCCPPVPYLENLFLQ